MKIYQIIVFFISVSIYSQCGIVEYGVIKKEINQSSKEHTVNSYIDEINNAELSFNLVFNQNESYFFEKDPKEASELSMGEKLNKILIGYKPYYFSNDDKTFLFVYQDVIVSKKYKIEWKLLNETKQIDNYICYKAIYVEKFKNRIGEDRERTITAWYCPELQFPYGPLDFNGLPGLILELEKNGNKYVVKNIQLEKEMSVPKLKGKIITEEEYIKKLKENSPF